MYIPSYQIHNVLDVYRKQLSQGTGRAKPAPASPEPSQDRIHVSSDGQRKAIMDRISSEIVDRIAQSGPQTHFGSVLEQELARPASPRNEPENSPSAEFSYTLIDQHNRRITNTLPLHQLNPMTPMTGEGEAISVEDHFTLDQESID